MITELANKAEIATLDHSNAVGRLVAAAIVAGSARVGDDDGTEVAIRLLWDAAMNLCRARAALSKAMV